MLIILLAKFHDQMIYNSKIYFKMHIRVCANTRQDITSFSFKTKVDHLKQKNLNILRMKHDFSMTF